MKVDDMARLERRERMMVRWMCGVHLMNGMVCAELNSQLGIECITDVVRRDLSPCGDIHVGHFKKHELNMNQTSVVWSCGENG